MLRCSSNQKIASEQSSTCRTESSLGSGGSSAMSTRRCPVPGSRSSTSDRIGHTGRAAIIFYGLLLTGAVLFGLGHFEFTSSRIVPVALVALVAFLMIGPYSYLAGAIALDLGGKQGSATTSGMIDGIGYLGGILAGDSVARVSIAYGWKGAFTILAVVVWLSSLAAFLYLYSFRDKALVPAVTEES